VIAVTLNGCRALASGAQRNGTRNSSAGDAKHVKGESTLLRARTAKDDEAELPGMTCAGRPDSQKEAAPEPPSDPADKAWMPHSRRSSDMAGTSTPYDLVRVMPE
jgi:hypothetical protein